MEILISLSAPQLPISLKLEHIQEKFSAAKRKKLEKWIQQELVKPDSSDYWTRFSSADEDLLQSVTALLWDSVPSIRRSPEPARATLEALVALYKRAH